MRMLFALGLMLAAGPLFAEPPAAKPNAVPPVPRRQTAHSPRASFYAPSYLHALSFSAASTFDGTNWTRDRLYFGDVFEPWPFVPGDIYGWPYDRRIRNPVGHVIQPTGENGYVYAPLYEQPEAAAEPLPSPPAALPEPPEPSGMAKQPAFFEAVGAFRAGNLRRVLLLTGDIQEKSPWYGRAQLVRSYALFALGDDQGAQSRLRKALDRLPPDQWGMIGEHAEDYFPDEKTYRLLLRRLGQTHRLDGKHKLLLAFHYGFHGERKLALRLLDELLQQTPDDAQAQRLREHFKAAEQQAEPRPNGPVEL